MNQKANAIPPDSPRCPNFALVGLALLLFVLVFALFSPSLRYGLVHIDDIVYIANNTVILDGLSISSVRQAFSLNNVSATMYMPFLWVSYMMDVEWLGATPAQPWGFHFTNVLLHAINSVLLFLLLVALCKKPWRAIFFAALWAIHPLRVESVAWIAERKDVLSGFFALLCVWAYVRAGTWRDDRPPSARPPAPFLLLALASFVLGLLVKPALAPLPAVLLLLDFWPLRRFEPGALSARQAVPRLLLEKIPFFLLGGLAAGGTVWGHHVVSGEIPVPLLLRIQSIPLSYGFYLLKTVWPLDLTVLYPHWSIWLSRPQALALVFSSGVLLLTLSFFAWRSRQRIPSQWVGWLWFLVMLLPVCGLIPIPSNDVADRFSYLPGMGLSIALLFLHASHQRYHRSWRWLRPLLSLLALALLSLLTLRQLPAWQSATSLTARVLDVFPTHATALETHAGNLMRATGDFQEANRLLSAALKADPHHWKAQIAKAQCLWALEGPAAAQQFLLQMGPPTSRFILSQWQQDLARYALMLGQADAAIRHAEQAMALLPPHDLSQTPILLLAMAAAFEKGDGPLALSYAHRFPPYANKATLDLADLLPHAIFQWVAGYRRDTYAYCQRLVQAHPDRPDFLNNVVWGLATAEWSPANPQEVVDMATRLCTLVPTAHPGLLDTLAAAQANAGDFESAIRTMQQALALFPPDASPELLLFKERLVNRLSLYEQRRPFREDAFVRMYVTYFGPLSALRGPNPDDTEPTLNPPLPRRTAYFPAMSPPP